MERSVLKVIGVIGAGAAILGIVALGQSESAQGAGRENLTEPSLSWGGSTFYTEDQIDLAWSAMAETYPAEFPKGVALPRQTPGHFHPTENGPHYFEVGLLESIAAEIWRCAWLEEYLEAEGASDAARAENARNRLATTSNLPGGGIVELSEGERDLYFREAARATGVSAEFFEYSTQCEGVF